MEWTAEDEGNEVVENDVNDESTAYLEFLNQEAQKFGAIADEDDDLDEESLLETPLDKVEPYSMFKQSLMGMSLLPLDALYHIANTANSDLQQNQPPLYEQLTKLLSQDEQHILQAVIHEAGVKEQAAAQAAAQPPSAVPVQANGRR